MVTANTHKIGSAAKDLLHTSITMQKDTFREASYQPSVSIMSIPPPSADLSSPRVYQTALRMYATRNRHTMLIHSVCLFFLRSISTPPAGDCLSKPSCGQCSTKTSHLRPFRFLISRAPATLPRCGGRVKHCCRLGLNGIALSRTLAARHIH